jgi:hypothetical protein
MRTWLDAAQRELGLDLEVDTAELLDLTRTVAHGVSRPAAPLTAFLVGYAAARGGGGPQAVTAAHRAVARLAERWTARPPADGGTA